jgi:HD-GYP domain-containing protein (c-di-GMP phosphodiesterase class II)
MRIRPAAVAAAATAAASAPFVFLERSKRASAERFAAAALETLLFAIDANDAQTGAHVRRVASYAIILGDAAELDEHQMRVIERVALFHDIGKIHEALFDIIHEDQTLTPAQKREVLTHPQRGARVLAPLNGFYPELPDGVLSHHERWNGSGYPRGLKGRHIPLSARIVAIADTFDAITYHRRYRRGRSAEIARQIIIEGRGTQFDPELVDLFIFPPVFEQVRATAREVERWKAPVETRHTGQKEDRVPDISFRWRPERRVTHVRPASDQKRRIAR